MSNTDIFNTLGLVLNIIGTAGIFFNGFNPMKPIVFNSAKFKRGGGSDDASRQIDVVVNRINDSIKMVINEANSKNRKSSKFFILIFFGFLFQLCAVLMNAAY